MISAPNDVLEVLDFFNDADDFDSSDELFGDDCLSETLSCASPTTTDDMTSDDPSSEAEDARMAASPFSPPAPAVASVASAAVKLATAKKKAKKQPVVTQSRFSIPSLLVVPSGPPPPVAAPLPAKKTSPALLPPLPPTGNEAIFGLLPPKRETASNASSSAGVLAPAKPGQGGVMPAFMFNLQLAAAAMAHAQQQQQQQQQQMFFKAVSAASAVSAEVIIDDSDAADEDTRPSAAARAAAYARAAERKAAVLEAKEAQRRRNRAAADRSRLRRRDLLSSLPAEKAALEVRVRDLEVGLAASQAEAQGLKDQLGFLRSLLAGGASSAAAFAHTAVAGAFNGGRAAAAAAVGLDGCGEMTNFTPSNVMLLAVACILTVNECGAALFGGPADNGGSDDEGLPSSGHGGRRGGRVLLSYSGDDKAAASDGRGRGPFLPSPVTQVAALVGLVLLGRLAVECLAASRVGIRARAMAKGLLGTGLKAGRRPLPLWGKDHAS